ncbi:ATPase [Streptomyces sp. CB03234]|uniref:sensor histidine kinase n=1 Tax=Streptomyces sp. (strain CB03234) TaxID=1703937 RepID=UPI00093CA508|nr:nitrate- and nitrite sensing domain-containing protein [Streptomyces sp. CB03234]OKJ95051.1 ATPase [Streptomyces sp. CB03234]
MPTPRTTHGPTARPGRRRAHAGPPATAPATHAPRAPRALQAPRVPRRNRRYLRPRTVRAKIISLLMVPVVSLLALWGFATVTTAQDVARLRELHRVDERIREPVAVAVTSLQAERRAAVRQVAAPRTGAAATATELQQQARRTDAAVAKLRLDDRHTVADGGDLPAEVSGRIRKFTDQVQRLTTLRKAALARTAQWDTVYTKYTATITAGFEASGALTGIQDATNGSHARVLLELSRAGEMLAREDTLLTSAHLTDDFTAQRLRLFTGAVETRRTLLQSATADLPGPERDAWHRLSAQRAYRQLTDAENAVAAAPAGRRAATAVPATAWDRDHTAVRDALAALETDARRGAADRAETFAGGLLTPSGAAVLLGLAAVAASLVISVRIGRALVVELVTLRNTALEIARRKLPHAMRRLRAGEELDIHAEAPPGRSAHDEIGQVREALGTVHRAALSAAVERAELSRGISGVFVNLARRSQVLVHRQLNLLDSMERRVDDPAELGDLFRLDHLTTRMRRHAESLIILSGAAPGRAWRTPVPLTNVVRAAVSEIEDYARVEVRQLPEAAVIGAAVADLTHLLAELVENAAQFSPPHTKVRVTGEPVGNGYALEIEDRGLGMGKEALEQANHRVEHSEALDLFDSDRLGLFVVSRLSARHDIKVHLRTSPYGGTTAVVLLPTALLQSALPAGRAEAPAPSAPTPPPGYGRPPRVPAHAHARTVLPTQHEEPPPAPVATLRPPPAPAAPPAVDPPADPASSGPASSGPAPGPTPGGDQGGLPRRVRQAHLVPQLREAPTARQDPAADPDHDPAAGEPSGRTPEQVRARMTAYHDGWTRGAAAPGATPAPRTRIRTRTGEGDEG